ncbi:MULTISPECIES: hypothetical protein, partial [unclassified Pseudomonas]|uniref:hypothetical protein n=1 Tax=unclassified Pseudomonas TaxID=196821 RepID=UPI003F9887EE
QPGPDDRAEGFGYFARKVTRPGGRNRKHQQNAAIRNKHPNKQQTLTQTCQSGANTDFPEIPRRTFSVHHPLPPDG